MVISGKRDIEGVTKEYHVFLKAEHRSDIALSTEVSEKGINLLTNLNLKENEELELRIVPPDEVFSFTCAGRVKWNIPSGKAEHAYQVGIEFVEGLKDFAAEQLVGGGERLSQRHSIIINASRGKCYRAITNYESYPRWQKTIKSVKTIECYPDSRPKVVEFTMEAIFKNIRFVNLYEYFDKDFILSWRAIGGDVKVNEGSYAFQDLTEDQTNAIFSIYIELGFYAPKRIVNYLSKITMRRSIQSLKEVVEKGLIE